ncbi:cystatin-A [Thomomys bottae]
MIPGGLSEARRATPEIQEIADQVKQQLEEKTNETYEEFEAIEYKSQVVAGTMFYIKIRVGDGRYTHIKVFRSLPGRDEGLQLLAYQTDKSENDELTAFD